MREIAISADRLVEALLALPPDRRLCLLDSCGVGHLGSHLLIAGIRPVHVTEITDRPPVGSATALDDLFDDKHAVVFTLSYDFGQRLLHGRQPIETDEPEIFAAAFTTLIIHDYDRQKTYLTGDPRSFDEIVRSLEQPGESSPTDPGIAVSVTSNFSKSEYLQVVEQIKEYIRSGDTYQTNLTQQIRVRTPVKPEQAFLHLREHHPAPFAAFMRRARSTVVSASPERFFRIADQEISASPIKGTRPRGASPEEDAALRSELLASSKDRAENTMIVDLLRNDLGRVCEFGSVEVEKLCDLEEHPTLFHLVSTIRGKLRSDAKFSEIIKATFPCGSITGAPKIRTMEIINELEPDQRGLSMGAIGVYIPSAFGVSDAAFDLSVAIRTMTFTDGEAVFNVGGGITIDSDPEAEYAESLLKAKALLNALGSRETSLSL